MKRFWIDFWRVLVAPDAFFEDIRQDRSWYRPLAHFFAIAAMISIGSVVAWRFGIRGDSPVNSSCDAQMAMFVYWKETLMPQYGNLSLVIAGVMMIGHMAAVALFYTPLVFVVFRYLGGPRERGGLLRAFQGFAYGLTPCAVFGYLPYLGLVTGVYATILQTYRGPSITLKNRSIGSYVLVVGVFTYAIARYWGHALL